MTANRKSIERANELQASTVSAWYLAICLMVVMLGGVWAADAIGLLDIGFDQGQGFDKAAVAAAARKAANREAQARLAAQQEARNLAEDSSRQAVVSASPVATASSAEAQAPESQAAVTRESK